MLVLSRRPGERVILSRGDRVLCLLRLAASGPDVATFDVVRPREAGDPDVARTTLTAGETLVIRDHAGRQTTDLLLAGATTGRARVGFTAPSDVQIMREELMP